MVHWLAAISSRYLTSNIIFHCHYIFPIELPNMRSYYCYEIRLLIRVSYPFRPYLSQPRTQLLYLRQQPLLTDRGYNEERCTAFEYHRHWQVLEQREQPGIDQSEQRKQPGSDQSKHRKPQLIMTNQNRGKNWQGPISLNFAHNFIQSDCPKMPSYMYDQ